MNSNDSKRQNNEENSKNMSSESDFPNYNWILLWKYIIMMNLSL